MMQYLNEKVETVEDIYFGDFLKKEVDPDNRQYIYSTEFEKVAEIITQVMKEFTKNQLVLFKDAVRHIFRICRITKL